eukprot:CAMPEP_0175959326 /NCGR_PEP_ID=MMETSP0108-20121206/34737_1 /TAXON_ID=195067 ORGANISM="Goniomonas pacifica, Strain CCMP1869" /NCGR_SAMPLE_ID=MMETSP0108 /ASSEMBLY_ACC=CAM_ASM_000204 /LENGTH=135 /DNA_ID=CAMNT_0017286771 /DNA_START=14 /DNA_END=421 /DNA_ORIENTATION=-
MGLGAKEVVLLAVLTSIGLVLNILACVVRIKGEMHPNWWPFFAIACYFLAPLPIALFGKPGDAISGVSNWVYWAYFTSGWIFTCSFGFVAVLAHIKVISLASMFFSMGGSVVVFGTAGLGGYLASRQDDDYSAFS